MGVLEAALYPDNAHSRGEKMKDLPINVWSYNGGIQTALLILERAIAVCHNHNKEEGKFAAQILDVIVEEIKATQIQAGQE